MDRSVLRHGVREAALWLGACLGALCLVLAAAAWVLDIRPLVFRSGSMSPEIEAGALALAKDTKATDLRTGDVVSVVSDRGTRVTHRVVGLERSADTAVLRLQGDANPRPDTEAYTVERAHRVFFDLPWAGHVVAAAGTPWGLLLCGGFVTLLLVSAFGSRHSGDGDDARRGAPGHVMRGVVGVTGLAVLTGGSASLAPMPTTAAFSDTATVSSGSLTPHQITPPGAATEPCTSGLLEFLRVHWRHSAAANIEYRVVVTSAATGAVAVDYGWTAAAATVGADMSREIRATGSPSVGANGNYWADVYARTQAGKDTGWTSLPPLRIAIRRSGLFIPVMSCGHA